MEGHGHIACKGICTNVSIAGPAIAVIRSSTASSLKYLRADSSPSQGKSSVTIFCVSGPCTIVPSYCGEPSVCPNFEYCRRSFYLKSGLGIRTDV